MFRPSRIPAALALLILPVALSAQSGRLRDANKGAPEAASFAAPIATAKVVREHSNVAALLHDARKSLALDAAAADSMAKLSAAIDARNAPQVATYDSLRTKVRAAQNAGESETLEGRARTAMLGTVVRDLQVPRPQDVAAALALVQADRQDAAKKLIADQEEELQKAMGGGGGRGRGRRP